MEINYLNLVSSFLHVLNVHFAAVREEEKEERNAFDVRYVAIFLSYQTILNWI